MDRNQGHTDGVPPGLSDMEARYRLLTEQLPAITYAVDLHPRPRTAFVSPQILEITGYAQQEWLENPLLWLSSIHPEDRTLVHQSVEQSNRTGNGFDLTYRFQHRKGHWIWIRNISRYLRAPDHSLVAVHGVMFDISTEVELSINLREADELNRLLFEQSPVGTFSYNDDLVITRCNPAFASILALGTDHLVGYNLHDLRDPRILACIENPLHGLPGTFNGDYVPPGSPLADPLHLRIHTSPLVDPRGQATGAIGIIEDLSRQRQVEEEQIKTQKLESLGLLAGGIAHDFNNILTAILGNLSMIREFFPHPDPGATALITEAEQASIRARDLTQQLLTFARGGTPIKRTHHLSEILKDVASLALRGSRCRYEFTGLSPEPLVHVDAGQVGQALQNLIINADEAMPEGGIIQLILPRARLNASTTLNLPSGDYLCLEVRDQGSGIGPDVSTRIFEPYYSTKNRGSGLGLTTTHAILRKHGGDITVSSPPGRGASFFIYLPVATDAWAELAEEPPRPNPNPKGQSQRILVMDDEPAVAKLARHLLEHNHYRVDCVSDGADAIIAYQNAINQADPYQLVILDLTVPGGMGGQETFQRLRVIDPAVRAIVSSGYSTGDIMAHYQEHGYIATVPKPYSAKDLLQTVARHIPHPP